MKYFHYIIEDDEVKESQGEIHSVPADFLEYQVSLVGERVFYKLRNGKVAEAIVEAAHEGTASHRLEEFLAGFNVPLV